MDNNKIDTFSHQALVDIRNNLTKEIEDASNGKQNSISFIKNRVPSHDTENGTKAQIIVIGGSNLISALATKEADLINIENIQKAKLPKIESKKIFLDLIDKHLDPEVGYLALNFGYPLASNYRNNQIDGKLITGTKEHSFDGLIDQNIGELIEQHFFNKRGQHLITGTANDIVCLILSGFGKIPPSELVGGVVGTGFNFGFFLDEEIIINLESGEFDKFPQTESGKTVDSESAEPGEHKYEKEIAGGYLYKHYNFYADKLDLPIKKIQSTEELDDISAKYDKCREVVNELYKRSASLVSCQIAAIHDFKNHAKMSILMEGSLFWKGDNYKDLVLNTLQEMDIPYGKVKVEKIEKSYILGAAKLVL
jgi:hexokinase